MLGFGTIQEHEYSKSAQEAVNSDALNLRVSTMPGCGDRRYMAFLERPEGSDMRLHPGDSISINFDQEIDSRSDDWSGFIIDPAPFAAMNDTTLIMTRPFNKETGQFRYDVGDFATIDVNTMADEVSMRRALMRAAPVQVSVRVKMSDKDMKRQINSLRQMQDSSSHETWSLLLGNDFRTVPPVDLFRTLKASDEEIAGFFERAGFNDMQMSAVHLCRRMRGGQAFIQGPPGCGKTFFLMWISLIFVFYSSKIEKISGSSRHQVLLAAAINDPVDDLARLTATAAQRLLPGRRVIIVRYHALTSEDDVVYQVAHQTHDKPANARPELFQESEVNLLSEMQGAHMVKRLYKEATDRPHGIADKRVKQIDLSLGTWMLKVSGVIQCEYSEPLPKFAQFRALYENYTFDRNMDRDSKVELRQGLKDLRMHVLRIADVVVTTLSNCADPTLQNVIRPDFIGIDEAGKATEPNMWHVLGYDPTGSISVGDQRQGSPTVFSSPKDGNCFAPALGTAYFTRMIINGFETIMFEVQDRMVPSIGDYVSKVFYEGKLKHSLGTYAREESTLITEFMAKNFSKHRPLIFVNVRGSAAKDPTASTYNFKHAVHGTQYVFDLLMHGLAADYDHDRGSLRSPAKVISDWHRTYARVAS